MHLSDGLWPRTFDKLTSGLALVQANRWFVLVGGDERGGQFLVQRQYALCPAPLRVAHRAFDQL